MDLLVPSAEGARCENPEALETIGSDLVQSFQSQSLIEESEGGKEPVNPIEYDRSATVKP